jgi:hypothetical protein
MKKMTAKFDPHDQRSHIDRFRDGAVGNSVGELVLADPRAAYRHGRALPTGVLPDVLFAPVEGGIDGK